MQSRRGELIPVGEVFGGLDGPVKAIHDKASDKRTVLNFRSQALRELKKIKLAWPELNYSTAPGLLILLPSVPAITPVAASPRLAQ